MSITAIRSAGDAIDATREYLLDRSLHQWLPLALMAIFLGPAGIGSPPGPFEVEDEAFRVDDDLPTPRDVLDAIDVELAIAAIAILGVFAVLYGLVSAFMEFGFVHSLATGTVAIREPAGAHWPRALALFVFRAVVWGTGATVATALLAGAFGLIDLPVDPGALGLWVLLFFGGGALYLLNRLTTDFVVPIMYHEQCGLLAGWQRLIEVGRANWRQYAIYVPVRVILEFALGIAFAIVLSIALVAIGIIVGIPVGVVLVIAFGTLPGVVITVAIIAAIGLALVALAMVPFHAYLRLYTLLVLGDTDTSLDLIPAERTRIRA